MNRFIAASLLSVLALPAAPAAWSQASNPGAVPVPGLATGQGGGARTTTRSNRQPAPPALPGARAEPAAVAPAERSASEMPPTEALFDAVNRGDMPAARDAIARGADLQGTNVLGLTPLELSVDLGRNEISFLLLSLRGGTSTARAPDPAAPSAAPSRAERLAALRAERASRMAVAARPPSNAAPQTARLFAGGGGSPVPQAGFLGFDTGR